MPRTSTIAKAGDARAALAQARLSDTFQKAPGAKRRTKRHADSDTDLEEMATEIFSRDTLRDDEDFQQLLTDAKPFDTSNVKVPKGAVLRKHRNGRVALHDAKTGRIKKILHDPPRVKGTGTFAGKAQLQAERLKGHAYEERVRRRVDAIGRSLFQSTGGLTPARRKALLEGYKNDRQRRGWRVPDV